MSASQTGIRFSIILFCASAGVMFQALHITKEPPEFHLLAKVVSARGMMPAQASDHENNADYYGTILASLESDIMKRRALEHVRALNPELKESEVEIRAAQTKGTAIFNLHAIGSDRNYTRTYLDALLDEFMTSRQDLHEQLNKNGSTMEKDVAILERANYGSEILDDWKLPVLIFIGAIGGALFGFLLDWIIGRLISLRSLLADT
jgi:hypothetical protein